MATGHLKGLADRSVSKQSVAASLRGDSRLFPVLCPRFKTAAKGVRCPGSQIVAQDCQTWCSEHGK
jgi:hypothetical protein